MFDNIFFKFQGWKEEKLPHGCCELWATRLQAFNVGIKNSQSFASASSNLFMSFVLSSLHCWRCFYKKAPVQNLSAEKNAQERLASCPAKNSPTFWAFKVGRGARIFHNPNCQGNEFLPRHICIYLFFFFQVEPSDCSWLFMFGFFMTGMTSPCQLLWRLLQSRGCNDPLERSWNAFACYCIVDIWLEREREKSMNSGDIVIEH